MVYPTHNVAADGRVCETMKSPALNRDTQILLNEALCTAFAERVTKACACPKARTLLGEKRSELLAGIITHAAQFPFDASVIEGNLVLTARTSQMGYLKDLSDGVTAVCRNFIAKTGLNQSHSLPLALLFQPALYQAYIEAGMDDGPHTKYTLRSC